MNNRQLYRTTFSKLHTDCELDWEAKAMETKKKLRCSRKLVIVSMILVLIFAMTCIANAATGGQLVDNVRVFINGQEVEVAVLGNGNPAASICGEIDSGTEFYDYDAKYISDCARLYIPARLDEATAEKVRDAAVRVFTVMGCRGLSRVDFFVTYDSREVVFNEINTLPGFTSISMYPKLFEASGIPYPELLDQLIELALEK